MAGIKETWSSRTYHPLHRLWPQRARRGIWALMLLELIGLIPCLVIFGIAQPDLYRTTLWRIGFVNRFNSDPNRIVYAMVNHQPRPAVALVWDQALTDLNVAISVLSLFLLLAKIVAFIMRWWLPLVAVVINVALVALYTVSTYGQIGPDYTDERYQSPVVWYLRQGCDLARPWGAYKNCQIAQGSLAATVYMLAVYLANLGLACWAMWPNKELNDVDEDDDDDSTSGRETKNWEMQSIRTPGGANQPLFTPRTQAFHSLDGQASSKMATYR